MLAPQMTADLKVIRDATPPGGSRALVSKGVSFGTIHRLPDGSWDSSQVIGIPWPSLRPTGANLAPSLAIRPLHQAGNVVSLREFTNNAFNHHHGIQSEERFGIGVDADGDGFVNELTPADVTAVTLFQATLPPPGRRVGTHPEMPAALANGGPQFPPIDGTP